MKIVGITGGIGSGKSTICELFNMLGIPVFNSDLEAKLIYKDNNVIQLIKEQFGDSVLKNDKVQLDELARIVFNNEEKLQVLNNIIHPRVALKFHHWCLENNDKYYVIKEAAIMIESKAYKDCEELILVMAPLEDRIDRVMKRNKITREQVLQRISNQMTDDEKLNYSKHVIYNDEKKSLVQQVNQLHKILIEP